MSDWSEGGLRIDVPYPRDVSFVCVEHPGLVQNDDKALETLGGVEQVAKVYGSHSKRLKLCWRPDDYYCKPTFADRSATTNILMKVRKRRRKSDGKEEYKIEILGRVETTYKYTSMCDFQYLPVRKKEDGSFEDLHDKIIIKDFLVEKEKYFAQDVPLFLPPISFSRVDRPCDFLYRQDIEHRQGYVNPDKTRPADLIGTVRERRSLFTIFVNFGEKLPTEPLPQALKKLEGEYVDIRGLELMREMFNQKPIWIKVEMEHKSGFSSDKLKVYLPALSFYWLDGPWRGQWNKFGFNPMKDTSAKIYQTLDFRLRSAKGSATDVKAKRSEFNIHTWSMLNRSQRHNVKINIDALGNKSGSKEEGVDREIFYKFKPGINPPQRMMYYPVNYIDIDEIQELIHSNDSKEKVCTEKDGWCVRGFQNKCRDIMFKHLQGYESFAPAFWKSKSKSKKDPNKTVLAFKLGEDKPSNIPEFDKEEEDIDEPSTSGVMDQDGDNQADDEYLEGEDLDDENMGEENMEDENWEEGEEGEFPGVEND